MPPRSRGSPTDRSPTSRDGSTSGRPYSAASGARHLRRRSSKPGRTGRSSRSRKPARRRSRMRPGSHNPIDAFILAKLEDADGSPRRRPNASIGSAA